MAVPDFQSMMRPTLALLSDGKEWKTVAIREELAKQYNLTEEDLNELLPSGTQGKFTNRIAWCITYEKHAGLVSSPSRGVYQITELGKKFLIEYPTRIDLRVLKTLQSVQDFASKKKAATATAPIEEDDIPEILKTPTEIIQEEHGKLRESLAQDILATVKSCSWQFFENLVVDVLVKMGYGGSKTEIGAGIVVGKSGDEGIDGIIKEDKLGLDSIYIQAKRWNGTVGRETVQSFSGALDGKRARKGVLITTSNFTEGAIQYARSIEKKIILINGEELAQLMIDYNVGVSSSENYVIKKIDSDYFSEI